MLKNFFGIQNSNQEKKESKKITVYLQTPNNEFYQSKKISVQQVNQTKQKKLKAIDHYQDKKSHELLRNWEFYKQQNKNYLYFSNQIEIISNIQGGNDDILFVMFEEKILQFNLQEDTDILFIDSSTLEDKLYELDLYHQKQIGNECLIEFGLQLFLQESFTKLIKFGDYFQQKFERKQFLNLIIKLGFADIYRFDQFDIKKFLIFLFVQSIDEEQSIINPRIKICSILQNINESDKEKLSQISEQLKKFFDWERIKNFIEKFFEKEADYDKCKGYYKFKQVFQLRRSTYAIFESKIKSEFEPNFNDIFNEKYMEDSGMTIQNYYDLFKQQQNKINKQSAQRYLEINYPLIGFLAKKIDLQNFNNKTKIENAIGEIIKKVFQEKDVIQSQKLMNNTKKLFLSLPVDMEKIQEWINLNEKCQDIRFENIKSEEIQIFQDALNSSQIEIKTHFDMLLKIKIINFDQSSTQNILFDVIVSNLIKKLQQIQQQKPYLFRQQIANLFETLETLYTNNWNNLNIPEKIRQAIDFELKRVEIQSIFQQETDEFQESVFTSLIKKIDVISNLSIIINQLENAKKMTQLESQLEHMNNLLNTTLKAVIEQLERIKETTDFYKSLGYLNEERVKKLIFEKIKKKCINTLIRTLNNLIVDKKVKKIEEWDIQFVLNEQIFDLFFNLIEQTEEFEQSELFIQIQQIMQKFTNFGDMMNWKDYKIVCEKKNQLLKYTRCLKLSMQVNLEEYAQFYEKFSMVKYFIQLMKKLEAEGLESLKQQIESLDKQDSEDIKDVEQQFNKSFADNGSKLLQISQYLIELKLFDEISAICLNKKNTIFQTSLEIKTKAIPYIEILYQYFLGLEFFDRTNQFQDEDLKQFKNEQSIELKNFYQVINKYFKNHFNLNHQDLVKECQYLNKICEKRFEGFDGRISPEFFIHLIQQSYNRILDYELLRLIQKIAQDFSIQFPNKYKEFYDSFCALFSQHELSKEQFMNGSQNMSDQLDQFLHETTLKCNNTQIDRRTLKFDVIPFISSVLCVMRLYSHIKNNKYDEYLQELLFDDDEDLAKRVQYFNQIKQILQEFANITKNCDILEYIQEALQFFYSAKGQSKTLRQQIEDISKFDDYIKQKINDQKNSQAQNSVKVLQMFIQQAKIKIQIDEEFLQQSFSASANNSKDQMSTNLEQDDKKYYHATYITQKNVNKKQKQENFNEEEIFQVLQRLSIISKEQLDQAYKKEEEKQQFQDNRKIFEEIYNLIQNNLIQNLEKFIQLGYIDEFVSEVEININGGSVILQVIDEVKTLIKEKEKQINNWKDTIQMAQQKYPVMRLISPLNYPNLLRYFLGILDISLSQDSKVIKKNSITISERQFMKSNSVVKYNVEELISFYHMQPKDLESKIKTNQDQIKIKLVNEKIQVIGEYLNQLFKSGQETLKFKEISKLTKNAYDQLVAKKIECNSYGDMCKKLLNAFGNKKQCLDRLQFFFANDQTTETDIEIFLNRVIYFEMVNDDIPRYFFIVDFKKLRYQVLKFATDLIEYYMITDDEQLKTKNELFLLYLQNQKIYKSSDLDDQTIEDYMRIPLTKDFDKQTPQYQNVNLHLYQSQQAGDGKTYQIKETIKNKNQCYVNVPAHQFQNVKNLLKILRSKRKELIAQENSKIQGIHIEIIYDKQDKISLLLFQIVVLNCISYNQNQFFVFEPKSNFYIEKSNYYGIAYANIMDHINLLKEQNKFIEFNIQHLSVAKEANSDDQIMLRYLFGLQEGEQYFMGQDFVKFECFDDQVIAKVKIFSDQEAQKLISNIFNLYLKQFKAQNKNIKSQYEFNYQNIVMFKYQFVCQIKEMEKNPNYTSYQINQYLQNASQSQVQSIKQLRHQIINLLANQALKNTFLHLYKDKQNQNEYYQNYMENIVEQVINNKYQQAQNLYEKDQQKQQQKIKKRETKIKEEYIQKQKQKQKNLFIACIEQLCSCLKNIQQKEEPQLKNENNFYLVQGNCENSLINNNLSNDQFLNNLKELCPKTNYYLPSNSQEIIKLDSLQEAIEEKNKISQYDQKINNLIFFNNESIIAAIFKDNSQEEGIKKLKELMKIFIQKCNQVAQRYENVQLELEKRVPNIDQTNDDYILIRTLIYVCSRNPNNYINEQNTEKNEKISKMKPDLINILQGKAFTKDNTCKLIQIAYKIYAGVPLVIMGETGIGKTVNIQILSQIMGFKFEILRLSAGTTVDQIISFMKNVKKELNDNSKVVIFFDEINTNQNIYGLLKEIFIEKSMNGKKISKNNQNIVCIAACNPYEYMRKNNRNNFEAGLLTRYQQKKASKATLTYHVYPLPESMLTFVVNYGQLEQSVEENNILQMLLKLETTQKFLQNELECIQKLIMTSQQFVRWQQESSRSCSLRDISRVIKFIQFFMESYFTKKENQDTKINNKQRAVILSLYLCYQLRLNQSQKDQYQQIIQYQLSQHSFFQKLNHDNIFNQIINEELNFFIDQIKIDSNFISKNKALKENCFCIAVCILTKVPLFITGEPGTSKTLSFTLVMNSFRGKSSESKFLKGYDSIKEFYIQGNLQIRSEEIKKAFYQAKNAKIEGILPVVFYDEAGQGEFSKHKANKCLHEELDENSVSFIASSNYSLDFAKQNRCLHLQRNKNSLEDLQEFVNQLVNSDTKLKKILIQFCEVYYDFHSQSKNYIHNSRDFYYTIKYCIFQFYTDPSMYQEEKYVVNLLYRAVIKNFSGYKENTNLIKQLFNKQFHQFKDDIQYNLNMLQIIQECFKPICKDFVYHSRFLMLITDNTDQGIEFARTSLEKNGFQPQVKAGSHFKKDIYEDKTREISSINASIEQNYSIISVNQDYIYAVYYDFFTMNFSKTGDKQRFRLNYKQIQTRVEVPQIYVFIMIVTVEQYMQMDLALINRFEKHIFTQNLMFSKKQKKILNKIIKEFDHIKLSFSKDQHFLSFIESSYISGLVQVECKKQVQKEEDLERICIDLIGNLAKKYDVVRLQSDKATSYFKDWNQKTYLDNLIEFAAYQKKLQTQQKQEKGFYSIIYTYSYLYNNYQALLKQKGYETMLVDLNSIKQKLEFQQQIEIYFEGKYNLVIIKISSQDENPQNIYYIRSYLDECRQKYQSKSQKSIIILIQHSDNNHYRLPFCSKWSQYQIDNLLPYVYTQSFIFNFQEVEIKEINNVLNYRNLYGKQVIKILENKRIFNYFTSMPGFSSKLVQRLQFRFDIDKEQFYQYYESARVMLEDHFQKQESFIYNDFFNYLTQYLKQATDQDDLWYQNFNLIKGFNYEKQLINYLKNQVENVLLTIFSQYEDLNLLTNFNQIQKLIQIQQLQYMNLFKQIRQQSIVISDSCDVKRIPHVGIKFIFSNFIYQKIENTKNKYESFNDVQEYQTYLDQELQIFQEILSSKNFIDYISDFLFYKEIKKYNSSSKESGYYSQFCDKLLSLLNEKQFFKEYFYIHVFFWNYERIFLEILELIQILKNPQYAIDLAQYLVSQEVFQNQKDILEAFSEFYYQILLNTNEIIEINKIEHFIKIFPQQSSSQRFQIINQCYKSFINYDKAINIKEISDIIKEGYEQNIFEKKRFENFNDISTFFMQISQQYDQTQVRNQYIQLYLLKLIYYENSNFFKQEIKNSSQNKKQEYTFIEQIQKLYLQSSFDPYEYPWCKENYIKKIENLEQIIQNSSNQKENFLVLSTLKMMKHNIGDQLFNQRQLQIFNTISNVKDQSSLSKFLIYLSSLTQENQFKQLNQLLGAQGSSYIQQIYVPFNSLSKQQAQALENKNVLECIVDRKNQYQCSCGYIYAVGDCGKNVVTLNCFNCKKKKIGGNDHKNIDKMYVLEEVQEKLGINLEFYEDLYLTPRQMDPLAFRFGNLVINCLLLISENQSLLNQKDCVQIITNQWKIIRSLLKLSDELLLIIAIELLNKFCKLNQKNFSILNNRNQFEQEFSKICQNFQQEMQSILQKFDNDAKNIKQKDQDELVQFQILLRDQETRNLFRNTLQFYQIPQQNELEGKYLKSDYKYKYLILKIHSISKINLVYPLIYFYKKIHELYSNRLTQKVSEKYTLSRILENKPFLLKYYEETVRKCWNELCQYLPILQKACDKIQTEYLESSDKMPLENFLIIKRSDNTKGHPSDQLEYFIKTITKIQNDVLKELSQNHKISKNLFELYEQDMIDIPQSFNLENLIFFENLQLEAGQQKKQMNIELLKNYYIFDQISKKCLIKDFEDQNYFQFKKDTSNLGIIYSTHILEDYTKFDQRLNHNVKERFLQQCPQQEQLIEIREQLFFLHDLMKNVPKDKLEKYLENNLLEVLNKNGFINEEQYFKRSLNQFKVSHIFDLLVILETALMDNLVQNLEAKYKQELTQSQFKQFKNQFQQKINNFKQNTIKNNTFFQQEQQEVESKFYKELKLVLGRYIIRNIIPEKYSSNFLETNIFECISEFYDKQFFEYFEENNIDFTNLNIQHKYIYNLYEKVAQEFQNLHQQFLKKIEEEDKQNNKNRKNQQLLIFDFQMDKQQICNDFDNDYDELIDEDLI